MNAGQLRKVLGDLLASELGTYKREDGQVIPAIFVTGHQQVPQQWQITGMECIVIEDPDYSPSPCLAASVVFDKMFTVMLTFYTPRGDSSPVIRKIMRVFPYSRMSSSPPTEEEFERIIVDIPDPEIVPSLVRLLY